MIPMLLIGKVKTVFRVLKHMALPFSWIIEVLEQMRRTRMRCGEG